MFIVNNLSVRFHDNPANTFANVSFVLNKGEALWLKGAIGVGKTTLLYAMVNVIPQIVSAHRNGSIELEGHVISEVSVNELMPDVSMVLSNPAWELLFPSIDDEIVFTLENMGLPEQEIDKRLKAIKDDFCLSQWDGYKPCQLSVGWQRMLSLAIHCVINPKVLLMDEPFSGLSADNTDVILAWQKRYLASGGILIVTDHQQAVMELRPTILCLEDYTD